MRVWILSLVLLAPGVLAQELTTTIDSVVVYQQGATLTRTGQVQVGSGTTQLQILGLPVDLDPNGLRAQVSGPGAVEVGQVKTRRVELTEAYAQDVRELESQLQTVADELAVLADNDASAKLQLKFLDGLATGVGQQTAPHNVAGEMNVAAWRDALNVLGSGADAARARLRTSAQAARQLQREQARLQRELDTLRGRQPRSSVVEIVVDSAVAQTLAVSLSYRFERASWSPRYEARLDSDSGRLRVVQKARVMQQSDESWQNVQLSLATSRPSGALIAPQLPPLVVDLASPAYSMLGMESDSEVIEEVVVTAARAKSRRAEGPKPVTVQPQVSNYAVRYALPGRVSVSNRRSDEQIFDLTEFTADTQMITRIVPSTGNTAFLQARFTYAEPIPLTADTMAVYVDDSFMGRTALPRLLPGEEATLPLGQDPRLEVNVTDQPISRDESGLFSRTRREATAKLFDITSRHTRDTIVEVVDRIPVAADNDIKVTVPQSATEPTERNLDDREGVVLWRNTLAPGENWRIDHRYVIAYPADEALQMR